MGRYNPFSAEPRCSDPNTDHPFTLVLWMAQTELHIAQNFAKDPNEAIKNAAQDFFGHNLWEPNDVQVLCVLYGHCELCMVEDEPDEFRWFK